MPTQAQNNASLYKRGIVVNGRFYHQMRRSRGSSTVQLTPYEDYLLASYAANLKAFYPLSFDAKDASAQANHAFAYSGVTFTGPARSGFKYPYVAKFDGAASQVRIEDTTYPLQLSRWTIMCWFKKTAAGVAASTSGTADGFPATDPIVPLVSKGVGESETGNLNMNWFLGLNKVSNGSTYRLGGDFEESTGPNHRIVGGTNIVDGTWYHAVFTFDGSVMKLYLNGVEDASVSTSAAPQNASIQKAGIGTAYTSTSVATGFFAGLIHDVSIWSEALTLADVQALYNKGIAAYRTTPTFTQNARDNAIASTNPNWTGWTLNNVTISGGSLVWNWNANNYTTVPIADLLPNTEYWCAVTVSAISGSPTLTILTEDGVDDFLDPAGNPFVTLTGLAAGVRKFFKLKTKNASGPYTLTITLDGVATNSLTLSDIEVFPIPQRSAAKIVVHGDRTGNFNTAKASLVSKAVLGANADALHIVSCGDLADTTNAFADCDMATVASCTTTISSAVVTAAAGSFSFVVAGMKVSGTGIPANTTVASVQSDAQITLNQNATASGSVTLTFKEVIKTAVAARGGLYLAVWGNHDYDGTQEDSWNAYFNDDQYNPGKDYYAKAVGNCEFFFFNDNTDTEQAGLSSQNGGGYGASVAANQDSSEGQYHLKRMAQSTAKWRIFLTHHPAYSSSLSGSGTAHARWDWAGLQVPIVLQAHLHGMERLYSSADGATYMTCGMGGGDHFGWAGSNHANNKWKENDTNKSGYLKVHDGDTALVLEYFDTSDILLDRVKITRS